MDVRSLGFRTDLALLALAGSHLEDRGDRIVVRTPDNPTYHWGNFYLLDRAPAADEVPGLLAAYDAEFPTAAHRSLGVDGITDQTARVSALVAAGPALDASVVMTARAVHEPPRPDRTAEHRRLASDADWAQRVELAADCHEHHEAEGYREFASRKALAERRLAEAGHGVWWGSFVDGRMVSGLGLFRAGEGLARYQTVETHPDFRGRGLAGTLVHRAARYGLDELGARTLVMIADPTYLAVRVYRSVGFTDTEVQTQLHQADRSVAPGDAAAGFAST